MTSVQRASRHFALGLVAYFLSISIACAGSFESYFTALRNDQVSPILTLQLRYFDLNTRDATGTPPLVVAISNDSFKVADYLIQQRGLDLDATNANDETAMMMAALKGQLALVQALIKRGAQVNKPGWTALHYAASSPAPASEQVAKLLLDNYAYIDAASPNQTTPLMMAARYGSDKVVDLLLKEGADATLKNDKGMTALDFARFVGRESVVALLQQHLNRLSEPVTARLPASPAQDQDHAGADLSSSTETAVATESAPVVETLPIALPSVSAVALDAAAVVADPAESPSVPQILDRPNKAEALGQPELESVSHTPEDAQPEPPLPAPETASTPMKVDAPASW